jgi:hypothetical protein
MGFRDFMTRQSLFFFFSVPFHSSCFVACRFGFFCFDCRSVCVRSFVSCFTERKPWEREKKTKFIFSLLVFRVLTKLQHPMRKYMAGSVVWKICIPLFIGLILVIVGIILDSLNAPLPGLSQFEFAFSQATFTQRINFFQNNTRASELLIFTAGIHYLSSFGLFLGLSCACAWAANHDPTSMFGEMEIVW